MTIVYNLANRNLNKPHSQFVYDMLYLSMQFVKELRYNIALYADEYSLRLVSEWGCVDEYHNINNIDYKLYDDIKVWIWYSRNDNYITLDSDVFLYERLNFLDTFKHSKYISNNKNSNAIFSYEHLSTISSPKMNQALQVFNSFGPSQIIKEWNYKNHISYNTGIIHWNNNLDFKKYFCECYVRLRNWFLENETKMMNNNSWLSKEIAVPSHFICEHLLYHLTNYYGFWADELKSNQNNNYWHNYGSDKFKDRSFINSVSTIVNFHKKTNFRLSHIQNKLVQEGKIDKYFYKSL